MSKTPPQAPSSDNTEQDTNEGFLTALAAAAKEVETVKSAATSETKKEIPDTKVASAKKATGIKVAFDAIKIKPIPVTSDCIKK